MSEMLGNRYFLSRQFDKALINFERALSEDPNNIKIKKRLIICNIQVGRIELALNSFYELVKRDPHIIIDTDAYYDDCPCQEIIPSWESKLASDSANEQSIKETLGMLYLFCDLSTAIKYFKDAQISTKFPQVVSTILKILQKEKTLLH